MYLKSTDISQRHNELLPQMVSEVSQEVGISLMDIKTIAVSIGPGSFTGLRVGLAYAKGIAYASGAELLPIGTLEALAEEVSLVMLAKGYNSFYTMTVARRDACFAQKFKLENKKYLVDSPPFYFDFQDWENFLHTNSAVAGFGTGKFIEWLTLEKRSEFHYIENVCASASSIGKLALNSSFHVPNIEDIEPKYLKEFTVNARS